MVLSSRERRQQSSPALGAAREVLWHDLECGAYRADLALWHELAEQAPGQILDVGAGTGRVALELARDGHHITALDRDGGLLQALRERASGLAVETVQADARAFDLGGRRFALCIAPMQTVQLLGGSDDRMAFLRRARAHLRPGGVLACAIVTTLDPFDCDTGDAGPSAESTRVAGHRYTSRATRVRVSTQSIVIERERRIFGPRAPAGELSLERNVVVLDRLSASELEREGVAAGLSALPSRSVAATEEHVGSAVVMLRA
jgi:SAM-dependent methyltransferase